MIPFSSSKDTEKIHDIRGQDVDNLGDLDKDEKTHVLYGEDTATDAIVQGMLREQKPESTCVLMSKHRYWVLSMTCSRKQKSKRKKRR